VRTELNVSAYSNKDSPLVSNGFYIGQYLGGWVLLEIKDSGLKVLCACIACLDDHFESISMITVWEES
jgi:hypothetical protein